MGRARLSPRRLGGQDVLQDIHPSTSFPFHPLPRLVSVSIFVLDKMAQPRAQAVRPAAAAPAQDEGIVKKLQPIIRSIAMFLLIQTGT